MSRIMRLLARLPWARRLRSDAEQAQRLARTADAQLKHERAIAPQRIRLADAMVRRGVENGFSTAMETLYGKGNARWRT